MNKIKEYPVKHTPALMSTMFAEARQRVPCRSKWLHYKGGLYVVVGHGFHTEDGEMCVLYQRIGGPGFNAIDECDTVFSRPIEQWDGHGATLMGNTKRFTRVDADETAD